MDRARGIVGEHFYGNFLDVLQPSPPFSAAFRIIHFGGVTVGDISCGCDVRVRLGERGAYHVDLLLSGRLLWRQGTGDTRVATTDRAAVFRPQGETVLERKEAGSRMLAVKIERSTLEGELQRMIDVSLRGPLRLAPTLDVSRGPGRSWAWLVQLLADDAGNDDGLAGHPLVGQQLREGLIRGLLVATDHQYRERLAASERTTAGPKPVRRAVQAIHDAPEFPFSLGELAEVAGVSIRSLQHGFRRHLGTSPMAYLREVRLARTHEELRRTEPATTGVAEVAHRWGFVHLGRFATQYKAKYGVSPSQTLRDG